MEDAASELHVRTLDGEADVLLDLLVSAALLLRVLVQVEKAVHECEIRQVSNWHGDQLHEHASVASHNHNQTIKQEEHKASQTLSLRGGVFMGHIALVRRNTPRSSEQTCAVYGFLYDTLWLV